MSLFNRGDFTPSSGARSPFRIDCDALADGGWGALAALAVGPVGPSREVVSVPTGGDRFAAALRKYAAGEENDLTLIADDVLTSGGSMERARLKHFYAKGVVAFARGPVPAWVTPLFVMTQERG